MPRRTISRNLSVRGRFRSIFCQESSATSLLWLNSKRATHCNLKEQINMFEFYIFLLFLYSIANFYFKYNYNSYILLSML